MTEAIFRLLALYRLGGLMIPSQEIASSPLAPRNDRLSISLCKEAFQKRKTPAKVSDEERAKLKIREQIKLENPFQTH